MDLEREVAYDVRPPPPPPPPAATDGEDPPGAPGSGGGGGGGIRLMLKLYLLVLGNERQRGSEAQRESTSNLREVRSVVPVSNGTAGKRPSVPVDGEQQSGGRYHENNNSQSIMERSRNSNGLTHKPIGP